MDTIHAIGLIQTPFDNLENMPIQPKGAGDTLGSIIVDEQYSEGLADLEGFSHIYLLYRFHEAKREALTVIPFMDDTARGVFATRSPLRPNHIGLSIVELISVRRNVIQVRGVDVLNNTPLLDVKPYISQFDGVKGSKSGWMKGSDEDVCTKRSDDRFVG